MKKQLKHYHQFSPVWEEGLSDTYYVVINQQIGENLGKYSDFWIAMKFSWEVLTTDFPIMIWELEKDVEPLYLVTLVMNSNKDLE